MARNLLPGRISTMLVWRHLSEIAYAQRAWGKGPWQWTSWQIHAHGFNA